MISKKMLLSGLASVVVASSLFGAKVTALTSGIAEERFQTLVVTEILKKMGLIIKYPYMIQKNLKNIFFR